MILEVNNTFDERRMYFLKNIEPRDSIQGATDTLDPKESTPEDVEKQRSSPQNKGPGKFAASWQKDFHVSPFNSRKGGYSLSATIPITDHLVNNNFKINNTITLSSSKGHPKLIARVFSTSDSIEPHSLSKLQVARFISSWWWVGLVTFPRIVREAAKLFFRRKLHVWYRPEVFKDSIGRNETDEERYIHHHHHPLPSHLQTNRKPP